MSAALVFLAAALGSASATILPRGTTALFNGGASQFPAFVNTLRAFNTAAPGSVSYATLPCYNVRGMNSSQPFNISAQGEFCKPFYDGVKQLSPHVASCPSIGMGGSYAYEVWSDPANAAKFADFFVAEAQTRGWDGYWIDMEVSAHTNLKQVEQGIAFLTTFGNALHKAGLRVGIEEKSTFINGMPARELITNSTVDSVVLWFYNGAGVELHFMGETHYFFGDKGGVMFEPSSGWSHDAATAKMLMCGALKFNLTEIAYWTNLGNMDPPTWAPAMKAYVNGDRSWCGLD